MPLKLKINKFDLKKIGVVLFGMLLAGLIGWKIFNPDLSTIALLRKDPPSLQRELVPKKMDAPDEAWTPIEGNLTKLKPSPIVINNQTKIMGKNSIFIKRKNLKQSLSKIIEAYEKQMADNKTTKANLAPTKQELSPIFSYYSNWEENPDALPEIVIREGKELIQVSPVSDSVAKTPIQSLREVSFIYKVPKEYQGLFMGLSINCQLTELPKITKEASNRFIGPKIRLRFLTDKLKFQPWKKEFLQNIPTTFAQTYNDVLVGPEDKYMELKVQTTRGYSITVSPRVIVSPSKRQ
jgi:hypothetical protein